MYNNSSISISISDDDSDELSRMRVRVRRKRKKLSYQVKNESTRRVIRFLVRYWPVLVFLPVAGLLLFEATRIGRKPSFDSKLAENVEFDSKLEENFDLTSRDPENKTENLNRLDPVTRIVRGVRELCLKMLPPEQLELLDTPADEESGGPINKLVYISENDIPHTGGNSSLSQDSQEEKRFNLFTGYQTFRQREESFKVNETSEVHCGFYNKNGGFKISDKDKNYMEDCKVVVSTCTFGGGDDLYQPIGMSEASLRKVCYVAFWDEVTLAVQEAYGNKLGDDEFMGKWRIVVIRDLPFSDQRLNGKIPKMLAHRLFPNAKYSIWVDSKSQFRRDPFGVLEALLWRSKSILAISQHGARSNVYEEAEAVIFKNKANPEEVEEQMAQYHQDGLPETELYNGNKALSEASVIVREHMPLTNLFMCLWFNEVVRFTSRDQLSFPYVLWRLNVVDNINIFPTCTRKDLANNIGHMRKVKPLPSRLKLV